MHASVVPLLPVGCIALAQCLTTVGGGGIFNGWLLPGGERSCTPPRSSRLHPVRDEFVGGAGPLICWHPLLALLDCPRQLASTLGHPPPGLHSRLPDGDRQVVASHPRPAAQHVALCVSTVQLRHFNCKVRSHRQLLAAGGRGGGASFQCHGWRHDVLPPAGTEAGGLAAQLPGEVKLTGKEEKASDSNRCGRTKLQATVCLQLSVRYVRCGVPAG